MDTIRTIRLIIIAVWHSRTYFLAMQRLAIRHLRFVHSSFGARACEQHVLIELNTSRETTTTTHQQKKIASEDVRPYKLP